MFIDSENDARCAEPAEKGSEKIVVAIHPISDMARFQNEWENLYTHAVEQNPCYAPAYVAKIDELSPHGQATGLLVIKRAAVTGHERFIGLLPIGRTIQPVPNHACVMTAQHSCYSGSSLPLIRAGFTETALAAMLDWLPRHAGKNGLLILKEFPLNGPVGSCLIKLLDSRRLPFATNGTFERPIVDVATATDHDAYIKQIKSRTRQTLRRKMRQLATQGELTFTTHSGQQVAEAMREFVALEDKGWKGRAGTSLLQDENGGKLAFDTLSSPEFGQTRIECLRLNGAAIAMNIFIGSQKSALLFKPTYDENYRKFSPGQLLHLQTLQSLYEEKWTRNLDSAVLTSDQLGAIWRQRQAVCNLVIGYSELTPPLNVTLVNQLWTLKDRLRRYIPV